MNAINYALARIRQDIPSQLLTLAFTEPAAKHFAIPVSVDSIIKDRVIVERVLVDCNVVGGAEIVIPLSAATHERVEPGVHVYRIPKQLTQNRSILSALNLAFINDHAGNVSQNYGPQDHILGAAKQMLSSYLPIEMISDARCNVIGDNVVLAEHQDFYLGQVYLRCVIENDSNMNHLNPRSWDNFANLCSLAVKAYIYMNNIISLDVGYMQGGSEIGAYRNIIDGYSDANETYRDFLKTTWAKTSVYNDPEMRERLIRITSGGGY